MSKENNQNEINDADWAKAARLIHGSLCRLAELVRRGLVEAESMAGEYEALKDAEGRLDRLTANVKALPRPSSAEGRQAEKRLRSAHRKLLDVVKNGANFYADLFGEPGGRITYDTISDKVAEGHRGLKALYTEKTATAVEDLEALSSYLGSL